MATQAFEWNEETAAALLSAFANQPDKLARMKQRLAETRATETKLRALRARKKGLEQRNRALRQTAGLPPADEEVQATPATPKARKASTQKSLQSLGPSEPTPRKPSSVPPSSSSEPDDEFGEKSLNPHAAAVPSDWGRQTSLYQYSGPSLKGVVSSVFEDGLLYRIITEHGDWAFYNDSRCYEMHVHYVFHAASTLHAGSRCMLTKTTSGAWDAKMTLLPEQTLVLVSGTIVDFDNKSRAVLLSRNASTGSSTGAPSSASFTSELYASQRAELKAIQHAISAITTSNDALVATEEDHVAQVCVDKALPFVDSDFFPDHTALCRSSDAFFIPPLRWSRPAAYVPSGAAAEVRLFRETNIRPWDLAHGSLLPDTSFVSAVRALAETPHLVRRLFRHTEGAATALAEHGIGLYRVQLCCGGLWRSILVDDYIPSKAHRPEFAHDSRDLRRIWLPLLEKAYAKACGSYSALINSSAEQVAQDLCGAPAVSLDALWPGDQSAATGHGAPQLRTFLETFYSQARGKVLLRPFSLATARTQAIRDQLELSYRNLGLDPGVAVVILGIESHAGHTLVRMRQTLATSASPSDADDEEDDMGSASWMQVWLDGKKPWAPALADALRQTGGRRVVYMDCEDIPQFFRGGCAFHAITRCRELRTVGPSAFAAGTPSHCLAIDVTSPTTLMATLTQLKVADGSVTHSRRRSSGEGHTSTASIGSLSAFGSLEAIGLQILSTASDSQKTLSLAQCTQRGPDIAARCAPNDAVMYSFAANSSVSLQLIPELSPYYVVPRIQSTTATCPYTLALFFETPDDQQISVSAVKGSAFARVLSSVKLPANIPAPSLSDVKEPMEVQYRLCSTDPVSFGDLERLNFA